jgi:cytidine deaminase
MARCTRLQHRTRPIRHDRAERTALVKAISEGRREFDMIVVATPNGGFPCGICRQVLYEFAPDLSVVIVNMDGEILHELKLSEMLPHGFGPDKLGF